MPRIQVSRTKRKGMTYENHTITIPKEILAQTGWGTGDKLKFTRYKPNIVYISLVE